MQTAALLLTKMKLGCSRPYINPTPVPKMPTGLVELMEGLSREVIKNNPSDLINFCAEHMNKLLELRDGRPPKIGLNLKQKITLAKNIVKQRAEQRGINYEKDISQIDLTDNKSCEQRIFENEFHHADKNSATVKSNVIQPEKNVKNEGLKSNDSDTISSQAELTDETLIEKEVAQTVVEQSDTNSTEVGSSDSSIEDTDSVRVLSNEINTNILPDNNKNIGDFTNADVNYSKDGNKTDLSKQEDTFGFSNITDGKVEIDFGNNIVLDNKFNHELNSRQNLDSKIDAEIDEMGNFEVASNITDISTILNMKICTETVEEINANIKSNVLNGEALDIKQDKSNDTLSNRVDNNLTNHNLLQNITCSSEITNTNTDFDIVNNEKNITLLKEEVRTEMIDTSSVHNEITYSDTKTDEVKSNNMNALVISTAEMHDMTGTELADDCVSSEEAAKINHISQSNEEAHDVTIAERVDGYVSQEEAPKNILIVQFKTENIEEINIEENNIKSDLLDTNTISDLKINEKKSGALMELSTQDVQTIFPGFSDPNKNFDQAVIILNNHDSDVDTSNKQLNEHETNVINIKKELKVEPIINNVQNRDEANTKKDYSQNDIDIEHYSTNDEYKNNNKQEHETTDTYNVNPMDLERAAITIQKVFRNFLFRSKTSSFDHSGNTEFNGFERETGKKKNEGTFANHHQNLSKERRAVGINRMDTVLQTVNEEKSLSLSTDDSSTISSAATVIQAHIRGYLFRNKFNRDKPLSNTSLVDGDVPSATSLEGDSDLNQNKTVLNIHIVPEGGQFITRDESLLTSVELSLDGSPPTSAKLHPLGYDKNERRKQLKREDAIQSISPPSNNSRLSDEHDSMNEVLINDKKTQKEQIVDDPDPVDFQITKATGCDDNVLKETLKMTFQNENSKSAELEYKASENSTDESDVVTPFKSTEEKNSDTDNMKLLHSGEFHDLVLPTKVSRSDTEVVSGE